MTIVTGHQPVYLPWLGLFHKIALADIFVFMDDVQYLTGDWNNRNFVRGPQGRVRLTAPVRLKASASKTLRDIVLAADPWPDRDHWQLSHWRTLTSCYARAPYWADHAPFFETLYTAQAWSRLADLNEHMLHYLLDALGIETTFVKASEMDFRARKSDLVLEHCARFGADLCVLGAHGRDYIEVQDFFDRGISLYYQDYQHPAYQQRFDGFESHLSVVDLLFNHGPESLEILLSGNVGKADLAARVEALDGTSAVLDFTIEKQAS